MRKLGVVLGCAAAAAAAANAAALGPTAPAAAMPPDGAAPAGPVSEQPPEAVLSASMKCERAESPGRVHCDLEVRAGTGESITWADVVIVKTPDFVGALRGRIGPLDATAHERERWQWAFALVARAKGSGEVGARVRLVVCRGRDGGTDPTDAMVEPQCEPRQIEVMAKVMVGG